MKIVVTSFGQTTDALMDDRFGRAEYFIVYDTDSNNSTCLQNSAVQATGGAGIAAAQQIIKNGAQVLVTGHLGPNAFEVLQAAGIKLLHGEPISVAQNIERAKSGQLLPITTDSPAGGHRHQGGQGHPGGHHFQGGDR